jgi:hypothetical protein
MTFAIALLLGSMFGACVGFIIRGAVEPETALAEIPYLGHLGNDVPLVPDPDARLTGNRAIASRAHMPQTNPGQVDNHRYRYAGDDEARCHTFSASSSLMFSVPSLIVERKERKIRAARWRP